MFLMVVRMNVLAQENIYHVGMLLARDTNPHAAMCVCTRFCIVTHSLVLHIYSQTFGIIGTYPWDEF